MCKSTAEHFKTVIDIICFVMEGRKPKHNKLFMHLYSVTLMTRTAILYLIDSISTLKTFIFTLTHKDIFEFTHYCVIIQYNEKNNTCFRKIWFECLNVLLRIQKHIYELVFFLILWYCFGNFDMALRWKNWCGCKT